MICQYHRSSGCVSAGSGRPAHYVPWHTCPSCKRKRPFDGRACRIAPLPAARPLPTVERPAFAVWQRPLVWFAELPFPARLLVLFLAIAVTPTFAMRI